MVIMARPSKTVRLRMLAKASSYTMTNTQPPHDPDCSVATTLATVYRAFTGLPTTHGVMSAKQQ